MKKYDENYNSDKNNKDRKNEDRRQILRAFGLFTQLGLSMACCVLVGVLIGRFLDVSFGTSPLLTVIFAFIGSGAAIKVMYDISKDWK